MVKNQTLHDASQAKRLLEKQQKRVLPGFPSRPHRLHRYLHIMKGEKSPRLSGQVLSWYSLLGPVIN
ncbi:hypothetical protein EXD76_05565 [BEV proteobacterium]|nr:hypothetical protein [Candidatus Symbiopectobacterium sp. Chty_BC]